jgi:hypothetical protein
MKWESIAADLLTENPEKYFKALDAIKAKVEGGISFSDATMELLEENPYRYIQTLATICAEGVDMSPEDADYLSLAFTLAEKKISTCLPGRVLVTLDKAYRKLEERAHPVV